MHEYIIADMTKVLISNPFFSDMVVQKIIKNTGLNAQDFFCCKRESGKILML